MAKKINITFSQAMQGHERWCISAGRSQRTIDDYQNTYRHFLALVGDKVLRDIKVKDIEDFMIWAQTTPFTHTSGVAPQATRMRRPKTCRNFHVGLAALWTWAVSKGFADRHIVRVVPPPKVNREPIEPLSSEEVTKLFKATLTSRSWKSKPFTTHTRFTAARDGMIVCLLVETAIRAGEALKLRMKDVEFKRQGGRLHIDLGKGKKSRTVFFGRRLADALNNYLLTRPDYKPDDFLVVNERGNQGTPMKTDTLSRLIKRIGEKVGVRVSPHRLRTTGACFMAQNGMDAWRLREIMGHSDLATTLRYVAAAKLNLDEAALSASPLDNLRL